MSIYGRFVGKTLQWDCFSKHEHKDALCLLPVQPVPALHHCKMQIPVLSLEAVTPKVGPWGLHGLSSC